MIVDVCTESLELTHAVVTRAHIRALVTAQKDAECFVYLNPISKEGCSIRRVLVSFMRFQLCLG
jgi:hypothetical protein